MAQRLPDVNKRFMYRWRPEAATGFKGRGRKRIRFSAAQLLLDVHTGIMYSARKDEARGFKGACAPKAPPLLGGASFTDVHKRFAYRGGKDSSRGFKVRFDESASDSWRRNF